MDYKRRRILSVGECRLETIKAPENNLEESKNSLDEDRVEAHILEEFLQVDFAGHNRCVQWRHQDYINNRRMMLDTNGINAYEFIAPKKPSWGYAEGDHCIEHLLLHKTYGLLQILPFLHLDNIRALLCVNKRLRNTYYNIWRDNYIFTLPKNKPVFASFLSVCHIKHAIWNTKFYVCSIDSSEDTRDKNPAYDMAHDHSCVCTMGNRLKSCENLKYIKIPYEYVVVNNHNLPQDVLRMKNMTIYLPFAVHDEVSTTQTYKYSQNIYFFPNWKNDIFENSTTAIKIKDLKPYF